ncbi:2OG-Fe dioxygenase family protein [Ramlibacter sp.]|nr:2OG-Fe dioxygenase family protein [Ramlibacter sp.]
MPLLAPDLTPPADLDPTLARQGFAVLDAAGVRAWAGCDEADLMALRPAWHALPPDNYLKDGGKYRQRRHSCFVVEGDTITQVPHRAHWQPLEYNALHGGMQRWFDPVQPQVLASPAWQGLLRALARTASVLKGAQPWFIEAHQFRIDTAGGIGRPTPEGAHRDGVDLVAVFLVDREAIKGGETRVFEAEGRAGERFTLQEPWSLLLLDDERVIHETTPIQPVEGRAGHRDTLVLTCRAKGFQGA